MQLRVAMRQYLSVKCEQKWCIQILSLLLKRTSFPLDSCYFSFLWALLWRYLWLNFNYTDKENDQKDEAEPRTEGVWVSKWWGHTWTAHFRNLMSETHTLSSYSSHIVSGSFHYQSSVFTPKWFEKYKKIEWLSEEREPFLLQWSGGASWWRRHLGSTCFNGSRKGDFNRGMSLSKGMGLGKHQLTTNSHHHTQ